MNEEVDNVFSEPERTEPPKKLRQGFTFTDGNAEPEEEKPQEMIQNVHPAGEPFYPPTEAKPLWLIPDESGGVRPLGYDVDYL